MQSQYSVEFIKAKLLSDQRWLERAILAIYEKQTRDEQRTDSTKEDNKVGFSAFDAQRLSYYAKWILSGRHLSGGHIELARKKIVHYAKQLQTIIEEKVVNAGYGHSPQHFGNNT